MKLPRLVLILLSLLIVVLATCVSCKSTDTDEQFAFSYELREQLLLDRYYLYIDITATNLGDDFECKGTKEDQFGTATLLPSDQDVSAYTTVHDYDKSETLDQVWKNGEQCYTFWFLPLSERIEEGSYVFRFTLHEKEYTIPIEIKHPLESPKDFSVTGCFSRSEDSYGWSMVDITITNLGKSFHYVGGVLYSPVYLISKDGTIYPPVMIDNADLTTYIMRNGAQYNARVLFREAIPDGYYDLFANVMGIEYTIPIEIK